MANNVKVEELVKDDKYSKVINSNLIDFVNENAKEMLLKGNFSRAIGANMQIELGVPYVLTGINYRSRWFINEGVSPEMWQKAQERDVLTNSDIARSSLGRFNSWLYFETNKGTELSFATIMNNEKAKTVNFWEDGEKGNFDNNIKDNKVTYLNSDIFAPQVISNNVFISTERTPAQWIKNGIDGLMNETLICVAIKTYKVQTRTGNLLDMQLRAWIKESNYNKIMEEYKDKNKKAKKAK